MPKLDNGDARVLAAKLCDIPADDVTDFIVIARGPCECGGDNAYSMATTGGMDELQIMEMMTIAARILLDD